MALLLGGCTAEQSDPAGGTGDLGIAFEVTEASPHLLIGTRDDRDSGFAALVIGQLEYLPAADCFVLDNLGDDTDRVALAWPEGTTATADGADVVVSVPALGEIRVGDWLRGGGYHEHPDRGLPDVPAECSPSAAEFAVLYDVVEAGPEPLGDG